MRLSYVANIFVSALIDFRDILVQETIANPRFRSAGFYLIKPYGFVVYVRGGTEDLYYAVPGRESAVSDFVAGKLRQGDVFVDVGANIGYYTLLAGKIIGDSGKIIAVEPVDATVKVLQLNLKLNQVRNVTVINKAAWFEKGNIQIEVPLGFFGLASTVARFKNAKFVHIVKAVSLDEVLEPYQRVKLIKIDVEGAELHVLRGLLKTMPKISYLVVEASTYKAQILQLLKEKGFTCHQIGFSDYIICSNKALV